MFSAYFLIFDVCWDQLFFSGIASSYAPHSVRLFRSRLGHFQNNGIYCPPLAISTFSIKIQVFSCGVTTAAASSSTFAPRKLAFAPASFETRSFSSSWEFIPRGGGDDDTVGSSSSSNNNNSKTDPTINNLDMNSLLSGLNLNNVPGMPDLSQPPTPEQIQSSFAQFQNLFNSPQFQSILNDPTKMEEQIENLRQNLLSSLNEMEKGENPMMKMMMEQMKSQMGAIFPGGWDGLKGA